jgi:hypothetical protein
MRGYGLDNSVRYSTSAIGVVRRGGYQVLLVQNKLIIFRYESVSP